MEPGYLLLSLQLLYMYYLYTYNVDQSAPSRNRLQGVLTAG